MSEPVDVPTYEESRNIRAAARKVSFTYPMPQPYTALLTVVPGYNELENRTGAGHGQHGMELEFALVGPLGAVSVSLMTHWSPLGVGDLDRGMHLREIMHTGGWDGEGPLMPPSGRGLVIHWKSPIAGFTDDDVETECLYLGETCWSTMSFTGADPVLRDFVSYGPARLYEHLESWYGHAAARAQDAS